MLGRNTAVVAIRLSSFSGSSEEDIFEFPIDPNEEKRTESFEFKGTKWEVCFDFEEVGKYRDIYDVCFELKLIQGVISDLCVSVAMKFHGFEEDNYLFLPSTFYGKLVEGTCFNSADLNVMSREKQSNLRGKYINVGDCLAPCLGFYSPSKKSAFLLSFKNENLAGYEGIGFMEMADKRLCEFMLCLPFRNLPDLKESHKETYEKLSRGEPIEIKAKLIFSPCKDLAAFYNMYFDEVPENIDNAEAGSFALSDSTYTAKALDLKKESNARECAINSLISILNRNENDMVHSAGLLDSLIAGFNLNKISLKEEDLKSCPEGGIYEIEEFEAVYFACKSLLYLRKIDDRLLKEKWDKDTTAFERNLSEFIDNEVLPYLKGKLASESNTICSSISILPAALTCLSLYNNNEAMLHKAGELAKILYKISFETKILIKGFPDEVWSYMLMESLVTIYEASGKKEWLDRAVTAGSLFSSWHKKYDYSGNALFRMFLYTEDIRYVNILKRILQNKKYGTDSRWKALNYLEIPGLYVNSKDGLVASIDTIDAKVLDRREGKLRVVITNPNSQKTKIRTMVDSTSDISEKYYLPKYHEMSFQPGETRVISF